MQILNTDGWLILKYALMAVVALGATWFFMIVMDSVFSALGQRSFKKHLTQALIKGTPSWEQVCTLAVANNVSGQRMVFVIQTVMRIALTEHRMGLDDTKVVLLQSYLDEDKKQLPYDGLPIDTRSMMLKVGTLLGPQEPELHPLAAHVRDLIQYNRPRETRQRLYTLGGFIFGIIGVALAAFTIVYPPSPSSADASTSAELRGTNPTPLPGMEKQKETPKG